MSKEISTTLLSKLGQHITRQMGLHFSERNWNSLRRGLKSAARDFGYADSESCARWLLSSRLSGTQIATLAHHLTTGETYFFRDTNTFEALENTVLPEIFLMRRNEERRLRIWSAGCSSGEEPYSIAILLKRLLPNIEEWNISIFASDVNSRLLQKARKGVYSDWSFRCPPSWLKDRYFRQREKEFELSSTIKRMVTFAPLNLAEDVYPSLSNNTNAIDIIFCRNVIMYFPHDIRQKVIQQLYHSLVEGGWLIVSSSEASSRLFPQFVTVNFPGATFFFKGDRNGIQQRTWFARMPHDEQLSYSERYSEVPATLSARQQSDLCSSEKGSSQSMPFPADSGTEAEGAENREEHLARAFATQGHFGKALEYCDRALKSNPSNPSLHYLKAMILQEERENGKAIVSLRRALFLDPHFVMAYLTLGNLIRQQGRIREASKHLERARQLLQNYASDELLPESCGTTAEVLQERIQELLLDEE